METYFECLAERALLAKNTDYGVLQQRILKKVVEPRVEVLDATEPDPGKLRDRLQTALVMALSTDRPPSSAQQSHSLKAQIDHLLERIDRIEGLLAIVSPGEADWSWGWKTQVQHLGKRYELEKVHGKELNGKESQGKALHGKEAWSAFLGEHPPSSPESDKVGAQTAGTRKQELDRLQELEALVDSYIPLISRRLAAQLTQSARIARILQKYGLSGEESKAELAAILAGEKFPATLDPGTHPHATAPRAQGDEGEDIRMRFQSWPCAAVGGSLAQELAGALEFRPSSWALARELDSQKLDGYHSTGENLPDCADPRGTPNDRAWRSGLMGLAFSGGGIRSATFNLGILQGLASLGLLGRFNYLSTVSGGGYIGAWLINWMKRKGVDDVERRLCPGATPDPRDPRLEPIRFLRDFSNYLTPQLGLLSADLWVVGVVWVRNTLLNLLVLLPALLAVLLIPRVPELWAQSIAVAHFGRFDCALPDRYRLDVPLTGWYLFGLLACALWVTILVALNLRQFPVVDRDVDKAEAPQRQSFYSRPWGVLTFIVVPIFVAAWFAAIELWVHAGDSGHWEWTSAGVWGAIMAAMILLIAKYPYHFSKDAKGESLTLHGLAAMAVVVVTLGGVTALLTMGLEAVFAIWRGSDLPNLRASSAVTVFGAPLIVFALFFLVILLAGFMGRKLPDAASKWLVRLRAYLAIYSSIWILWTGVAIYGSWLYDNLLYLWYAKAPLIAAWAWTTVRGVLAGKSSDTSGGKADWKSSLGFYATVGPYVFIAGLFLAMSVAADRSLKALTEYLSATGADESWITRSFSCAVVGHEWTWSLFIVLIAAAFLSTWLSFWFDVNEFSLNRFYRSRLVRCYLGAANDDRKPNPFTGFDPADDSSPLSKFSKKDNYEGPFPIFNATLNLVHGDELAWQERRGASFVFTPELCGYETPWHAAANPQPFAKLEYLGYRETADFAYPSPGMHLGIPMSVSGAALSPNMGFYSRAATGFLMTIFNARLGWWLGNPRHKKTWRKAGPTQGLAYLTKELMGLTNDRSAFVYVSDGGHFENLAIYELVRRRCRYIVACDGEEDAKLAFNGLGNAIRKCRTDFGVEIDIGVDLIKPENAAVLGRSHCVVGTIQYPDQVGLGYLVYLKASIVGSEPEDVLQYRVSHPTFPHQSTADQWFTESQFESYRRLGLHVAETTFKRAVGDLKNLENNSEYRPQLFEELRDIWFLPAKAIQQNFTRHAQALDELVREMRADATLVKLHDFLIPVENPKQPKIEEDEEAKVFLFLSSVIQLMENIYIDLDLEANADHPHCAGWIQIFQAWAKTDIFQKAWHRYGWVYGRNFKRFCTRRFGLGA